MATTNTNVPRTHEEIVKAIDGIFEKFNKGDAPGMVAGVSLRGRTIYRRGVGLASVEQGVANQPSTRMRIGSTSKHFAALAALLLAEEGRLDLDAPARKAIAELPAEIGDATLRQFMTHTSGMRDYLDLGFITDGPAIKPRGTAMQVQTSHRAMSFRTGTKATYNNGGYHLLSVAIDRAAGMPMEEFVKARIFEPIGMLETIWSPSDFCVNRGMAGLYLPDGTGGWRKGMFPSEEVRGEGGMVSTVDDMLRWLAHMRSPHKLVGADASWKQMTQPAKLANGSVVPYGLGLMLGSYRGTKVVHHGGGVFGGACQMLTVPDSALDIVILTNGALVSPLDLADQVIDAVLGDALDPAQPKAATEAFASLAGKTYGSLSSGMIVRFIDADGVMCGSIFNSPPVPLWNDDGDLRLPFEKVVAGPFVFKTAHVKRLKQDAPATLQMTEGGEAEELARLDEAPSKASLAQELVGRYSIPDLGAPAAVTFKEDRLELRIDGQFGNAQLLLTPVSKDLCLWEIDLPTFPFRGSLRVEREGGAVNALLLETLRTRRLKVARLS